MREALFIKKNKDRWLRVQHLPSEDPDEMAADFINLVDDLAYAKTFYPAGKVTPYINAQAARIYLDIYRNRREETNRIWRFWKTDLPLTLRRHHRLVLVSFLFFTLFFMIGFFTAMRDESIPRSILGDEYVDMTHENIRKGNPFGVYEGGSSFWSWMGIMFNNLIVAIRVFASGVVLGVPALFDLAKTGVMVGAFDQLFSEAGLGPDFWMVVFVHGTLEITAFILVGAGALVMGLSFLFPGSHKRIDAFKRGAKDGVKIMVGQIPVLALAAFFEGFITRLYNDMSWLTTFVFAASVLFVVWYFVLYPIQVGRRHRVAASPEEDLL